MKYRIRNHKDVAAGVIYVLAGAAFSVGALDYKLGDAARMGPGWFPFWVGILLIAVGAVTSATGFSPRASEERIKRPELGSVAWILGAVVLFGLLLQPAGLVISLAALVIVSSMGSHEFSWKGALLNTVVMVLFSVGAFVLGIHLQIPLWPAFLGN